MKKIGILTYQYANNYGALLQCYALRKVINKFPDCKAEIINYVPVNIFRKNYNSEMNEKLFQNKLLLLKNFLKEKCGMDSPVISQVNEFNCDYDYYCVGSDQVWNTAWLKEEYFLPNILEKGKKISYAASIGLGINDSNFNEEIFKKYLPDFAEISVREKEHSVYLEKLLGRKCDCVLDPTLLLSSDEYDDVIYNGDVEKENFIFFFWLQHDHEMMKGVEFVNSLSRKYNLPVVHNIVAAEDYLFAQSDKCMMFEGVDKFIWYIKNASYVVTNSYHATLFSIQYKKIFWNFNVDSMKSRILTVEEKLRISDNTSYSEHSKIINYDSIYSNLENEQKKSIEYLKKALDV